MSIDGLIDHEKFIFDDDGRNPPRRKIGGQPARGCRTVDIPAPGAGE